MFMCSLLFTLVISRYCFIVKFYTIVNEQPISHKFDIHFCF